MENIRKDFTTITWVMIPVAIAVNVVIGQLVVLLKLPVYLDSLNSFGWSFTHSWAGALREFSPTWSGQLLVYSQAWA